MSSKTPDFFQELFFPTQVQSVVNGKEPILDIFPTDNWIGGFLDYIEISETPSAYAIMMGFFAISSVVGRKIFLKWMGDPLFLNLWIFLMGEAGTKKDTAVMQIMTLLDPLRDFLPQFLPSQITTAALTQHLAYEIKPAQKPTVVNEKHKKRVDRDVIHCRDMNKNAEGILISKEASLFFGGGTYNKDLVGLLCELYDCPKHHMKTTLGSGEIKLKNGFMNVILNINLKIFENELPNSVHAGGFLSRFMFGVHVGPLAKKVSIPDLKRGDLFTVLSKGLRKIATRKGQFGWTPAAKEFYDKWYCARQEKDSVIEGYQSRKPIHMLKLAMLLILAEGGPLQITINHLEKAIRLMDFFDTSICSVLEGSSMDSQIQPAYAILKRLSKPEIYKVGMALQDLHPQVYRTIKKAKLDFYGVVNELLTMNRIENVRMPNGKAGIKVTKRYEKQLDNHYKGEKK